MSEIIRPSRRGFIGGLIGLIAAPALVRASNIMPVRSIPIEAFGAIPDGPVAYEWTTRAFGYDIGKWWWRRIPWTLPGPEPTLMDYVGGPLHITNGPRPSGPPRAGVYIDTFGPVLIMNSYVKAVPGLDCPEKVPLLVDGHPKSLTNMVGGDGLEPPTLSV
jgi:hypothetical protein